MSELHEAQAAFCGLHRADESTVEIVELALDGDAKEIGSRWAYAPIERAYDALSNCAYWGCGFHGDEPAALKVLRGLMDEAEEEDAQWQAEQAIRAAESDARDEGRTLAPSQLHEIAYRAYRAAR